MAIPSTVIVLGWGFGAFSSCRSLTNVQFCDGLQTIGAGAFIHCTALRSVTIPSTVTKLGTHAFYGCTNLPEVTLMGGERLLSHDFIARGMFSEEQGLLDQGKLTEFLFNEDGDGDFAFHGCPLITVKISISWLLSERMARLPQKCRLSVLERIRDLRRLGLMQDGTVLACFPVVNKASDAETEDDSDNEDFIVDEVKYNVQDPDLETARSLYRVLQLVAFHELKESSILVELAMWKLRMDEGRARADCRVTIPGPAKSLIMEYCGFAGFLKPSFEGF